MKSKEIPKRLKIKIQFIFPFVLVAAKHMEVYECIIFGQQNTWKFMNALFLDLTCLCINCT